MHNEAQVLISGAGPSGLMMALMLSRYNIPVRIIDMAEEKSPFSRAVAVQIRSLEIFSSLGLLEHLREKAQEVFALQFNADNEKPIDIKLSESIKTSFLPWMVEQPHTEEVLEKALESLGIVIERGVLLLDYTVKPHGIEAVLEAEGKQSIHHCKYLIGADGAHSIVRKKMPTGFSGSTYEEAFILADAECHLPDDHHTVRFFFRGQKFFALIPLAGFRHFRLISVRLNDVGKQGLKPTIDEFRELAESVVPFPIKIEKMSWASRFFVQCRTATDYQKGNIFLVGDAAHIHSPAGGQGMNTGLQDAFNLAFKIAMVEKALAREDLLLSYQKERRPVGEFLIKNTDRLFKVMIGASWLVRVLRRFLVPFMLTNQKAREKLFRVMSQTAICYKEGALCRRLEHAKLPNMKIGLRVPNMPLIDSHLAKTDLHRIAVANFFTCFLFFPANMERSLALSFYKAGEHLTHKFAQSLRCVYVFASDFDAEKIMNGSNYYLIDNNRYNNSFTKAFYLIVRADQHIFCQGFQEDISHAEASLQKDIL